MKKGLGPFLLRVLVIILVGTPMLLMAGEFAVRQTSWRYLTVDETPVFPKRYFQESPDLGIDLSENHSEQKTNLKGTLT